MPEGSGRRLTDEEEERIVELRLERVPERTVAQEIGCQPNTVPECMRRGCREGRVVVRFCTERIMMAVRR